jgi:hypothetical protein
MGGLFDIVSSLSWVSLLFILAILAAAILFNLRYTARVVELGPTILTTLGIFGTFLGVAIGLSHFDTGNVQASVPALLAGLKTAFWASVFGVGAAVQLKMREFLAGGPGQADSGQRASPIELLSDIRDALAGQGEGSLVQQLRLVRQDLNDRLLAQIRAARQDTNERLEGLRVGQREMVSHIGTMTVAQDQALRQLAENGAGALVGALQHVVTDFNQTVAAQFGENYRELGQAVRQLLAWQTAYKDMIAALDSQLADTLRSLGYAASDFRAVTQGSDQFVKTAERVARTMDGIEASEERLTGLARGLSRLTEEASGRVPYIEARLYELTTQMTQAVHANQAALHAALTGSAVQLAAAQSSFATAAQAGAEQVQANQAAIAGALADNARLMGAHLHDMQADMLAAMRSFGEQMQSLGRNGEQRVRDLDQAAASDLTQAMDRLIRRLTTQIEKADSGLVEKPAKPRRALQVVADAGGEE